MAFIGIFFIAVLFWIFLAALVIVVLPSFIIALVNLIQGIKHHWPRKNIVLLSIFGSIAGTFILFLLLVFLLSSFSDINNVNSSSNEMISLIFALLG